METRRRRWPPQLLGVVALLCLVALLSGCGGSDSSSEDEAGQAREAAAAREEQETQKVKEELENGDFVDCGGQVFVNKRSLCTFAKNMRHAYYVEVVSGSGKAIGYHPLAKQDFRVYCTGTVPHKCTGFEDDGGGIESLKGGVIFFSP